MIVPLLQEDSSCLCPMSTAAFVTGSEAALYLPVLPIICELRAEIGLCCASTTLILPASMGPEQPNKYLIRDSVNNKSMLLCNSLLGL